MSKTVWMMAAVVGMFAFSGIARAESAPAAKPVAFTPVAVKTNHSVIGLVTEREFADDITRRLRRMGINFNRTRLPNPYDPAGDLC